MHCPARSTGVKPICELTSHDAPYSMAPLDHSHTAHRPRPALPDLGSIGPFGTFRVTFECTPAVRPVGDAGFPRHEPDSAVALQSVTCGIALEYRWERLARQHLCRFLIGLLNGYHD